MDELQKKSVQLYRLKSNESNKTTIAGRFENHTGTEEHIWNDLKTKISPPNSAKVLDIGCGAGELALILAKESRSLDWKTTFLDIPEIISKLKSQLDAEGFQFEPAVFPYCEDFLNNNKRNFDLIIAYSVIHYTSEPQSFIDAAFDLLADNGQLIIGDLPNVNKKGRFLSSSLGREVEAKYRNTTIDKLPAYKDQFDFIKQEKCMNSKICDDLVMNNISKYRELGHEAHILYQSPALPFSYTREDLVITKR
ncbi:MAG: hypothetical protein CME71_12745 [Halobacteriovorax sp.]|nr:hypothetical protein [Halobacteriovorax sp.]|tara:strand:- start:222 stop:974 length:753 start_codon:yes stop_codon:yes gene_type:complete